MTSAFATLLSQATSRGCEVAGGEAETDPLSALESPAAGVGGAADHALLMEREIIASCLQDSSAVQIVEDAGLRASDFVSPVHETIFRVLSRAAASEVPIDPLTVARALEGETGRQWVSTVADIAANSLGSTANAKHYAEQVKESGRKRRAIAMVDGLRLSIEQEGLAAIDKVIQELMSLGIDGVRSSRTIREALQESIEHIEEMAELGDEIPGVTTGISELDDYTGGFHPSDLVVVGARPSMGKTAFLLNCALSAASRGGARGPARVGIISTEQPCAQLGMRWISIAGRVDASDLRKPATMPDATWPKISHAVQTLTNLPVWVDDSSDLTVEDIARRARQWKHHNNIDILYIDYLQRIQPSNPQHSRTEQVSHIARGLKSIGKSLNIPVVALAQVGRQVEERQNKRPMMSDLKESGAIEQEADLILTLYRDEVYNADTMEKGVAEIGNPKNRHGPVDQVVKTHWDGRFLRFSDYDPLAGSYESHLR